MHFLELFRELNYLLPERIIIFIILKPTVEDIFKSINLKLNKIGLLLFQRQQRTDNIDGLVFLYVGLVVEDIEIAYSLLQQCLLKLIYLSFL